MSGKVEDVSSNTTALPADGGWKVVRALRWCGNRIGQVKKADERKHMVEGIDRALRVNGESDQSTGKPDSSVEELRNDNNITRRCANVGNVLDILTVATAMLLHGRDGVPGWVEKAIGVLPSVVELVLGVILRRRHGTKVVDEEVCCFWFVLKYQNKRRACTYYYVRCKLNSSLTLGIQVGP